MIAFLVLICSSYTLGCLVLQWLRLRCDTVEESLLYSIGLGLGLWCFPLFLLGHLNLFYGPLLMGIAIACALPGPFIFYGQYRHYKSHLQAKGLLSPLSKLFLVVTGIILVLTFLSCFAPVTGGIRNDEICLHLSIPHEWLRYHGIVMLPFSISYQAGNAHLLFLLTSCFNQESGPRLVSWLCFVLCLSAVYVLARKILGRNGAIIAVLVTAVNPLVFRTANIAFVDLASAFFAIVPLCVLAAYHNEKRWEWLAVCGFFMGVGCGIKPTNIIYTIVTILVAAVSWLIIPKNILHTVRPVLLVCTITALVASPWPVRNLLLTGSPTFPPPLSLYSSGEIKPFIGDTAPYSYNEIKSYYDYCLSRYGDYKRNMLSFVRFPWELTMGPERFQIGDSVGTLLLSFFPLVFLFCPLPRLALFLIGFAAVSSLLLYFAVLPEARYFIACFIALGPVVAYAVTNLIKYKYVRSVVVLAGAINLLFSLGVAAKTTKRSIHSVFSTEFRTRYCQSGIPYFEAFEYLRSHNIDTVLVMAPDRIFYYLHGEYKVDTALDHADFSYAGHIALDIDYSQVLGRDASMLPATYSAGHPLPDNTRLLFERPDARIYTFANPIPKKGH